MTESAKGFLEYLGSWRPIIKETDPTCNCDEFKKATQNRTDSEGYHAAITPHVVIDTINRWPLVPENKADSEFGLTQTRNLIKFCPWCGKKVKSQE